MKSNKTQMRLVQQYHSDSEIWTLMKDKMNLIMKTEVTFIMTKFGVETRYKPEVQKQLDRIDELIDGIRKTRYSDLFLIQVQVGDKARK